jgi:hypothetical protein
MNSIQRSIQKAKKALNHYFNVAAPENNLAVRDLLADIKHYCDAHTIDFYAELETAHRHYTEEVVEARWTRSSEAIDTQRQRTNLPVLFINPKHKGD